MPHWPLIALLLLLPGSAQAGAMFTVLGIPVVVSPVVVLPLDVSADGSAVVGTVDLGDGRSEAFRWTMAGGMQLLGTLPEHAGSQASAISADGSVVVGTSTGTSSEAFRWEADAMTGLGTPGLAGAVSSDGSVIAGIHAISPVMRSFRWTADEGVIDLGSVLINGSPTDLNASGVSGDGSIVIGSVYSRFLYPSSFRWTAEAGVESLRDPSGTISDFEASAISSDGRVVVGSESRRYAIRWTEADGAVRIGPVEGAGIAKDVSGDGSIIVGNTDDSVFLPDPWIWDETSGMRSLVDVLVDDLGLDLGGFHPRWVSAISDDGTTIVGQGYNASGMPDAWIAVIPEPATGFLLGMGLLVLSGARRVDRRPDSTPPQPARCRPRCCAGTPRGSGGSRAR